MCSALGVAPGVKAGALWGRCPGQVLNVETVPDPSVGSASCQHTGNPSQTLHRQDCAAAAGRGQCSSLVSCSEVAPVLCPGSAPRQLNYTE